MENMEVKLSVQNSGVFEITKVEQGDIKLPEHGEEVLIHSVLIDTTDNGLDVKDHYEIVMFFQGGTKVPCGYCRQHVSGGPTDGIENLMDAVTGKSEVTQDIEQTGFFWWDYTPDGVRQYHWIHPEDINAWIRLPKSTVILEGDPVDIEGRR